MRPTAILCALLLAPPALAGDGYAAAEARARRKGLDLRAGAFEAPGDWRLRRVRAREGK